MKKYLIVFAIIGSISGLVYFFFFQKRQIISPLGNGIIIQKPLNQYTFENLKQTVFSKNPITLGPILEKTETIRKQLFYFSVPSHPGSAQLLTVSGVITTPITPGTYPVIVMFRGYAPQETYTSGIGTGPSASVFAAHGFITLAPDFLGYGTSSSPSADSFEERFQTYTTALSLFSSLPTLTSGLEASYAGSIRPDLEHIGLWGHSNGGHIALATLAISGVPYPTVLWAPVSKSFPYSILYYTDEYDDQGKMLRAALAKFEKMYDTEQFSPINYLSWIRGPIAIHQGTNDQEVPVWWSNELVSQLKKDSVDVTYFTYPGADYNLLPFAWNTAVTRSMEFYKKQFEK